jgi:hypothetical protein
MILACIIGIGVFIGLVITALVVGIILIGALIYSVISE